MNLRPRRMVAVVGIAALLFMQLAVAAFACPGETAMLAAQVESSQSMPSCDGMGGAPSPLCKSHCAQGSQSLEKHQTPTVPPAAVVGIASWRLLDDSAACWRLGPQETSGIPPPEPPLAIRNCCLRI